MYENQRRLSRRTRSALVAGASTVIVALALTMGAAANAATLFSDDFSDGNSTGWSTSGGTWSVASGAYAQSSSSASAKALAGSTSWSTATVSAKVRATTFGSSASRGIGIAARAQSTSNFYALVLTATAVQIRKGATTTLATAPFSASAGTTYTLSLSATGSSLVGSVNGSQVVSVSDGSYATGRAGLVANYVAGTFDDVLVTDAAGPSPSASPSVSPPSSPSPSPSTSTSPPPPPGGIVGWATQGGGTTGGAGGATVTVSTFADFKTQAQAAGTRTILVNGMLSGSGTVEISANKTIQGVGASSGISGSTLNIEDMHPANVIIQNLNIRGVLGNDAIQIENATHIWIDHNTMTSTIASNPDVYDGMIDITHAGDYITVSWNIIRDHWKTSLVGHSDGNAGEDVGHLRVTYHHNWFDHTFERSPRVRFGETVHVFNNYYTNVNNNADSYAIASVMNAGVLVEGNVFENVQQACWSASGYADSDPGRLVARNNSLTNSGPCETNGTVAALPYGYTAADVGTVKSSVTAGAGAGKL
ncbi:pectate lyase [Allocatelliglobosispora scoriae]|uniref:Pectate lyase n=1 Tax=Allocatelliglobosispora scoriae TaxID=643052 RepID=A0A841BF30_9ACTN|nr:polysaccharide lyase family 1 protein [Allocatelliglobosispora scoriae]MBB5866904.1 pectate lyase [Allocatelliglobosispora scoriae]